ncbi:MAG: glycoside hydrolase family 127 protein [Sedimentisphaerales bacterium]|nr:glycoside hydrolase family 127 protein [Sedimentisphaerales bacterium]
MREYTVANTPGIRTTACRLQRVVFIVSLGFAVAGAGAGVAPLRGLQEVNHSQVELRGGFWGSRLRTHHEVTVPHALDCLERNGHVTNFDKAAGTFDGPLRGHHAFDSDIHKAMEGAMYSLQHHDDPELRRRVEGILDRILAAQQEDGYLISYFIVNGLDRKWEDLRLEHQMYNAGHFFEMAVEHQRLTGQTKATDAARRFADHIDSVFGPGKRYDVGGHEEIELALVKLYRATGERRYLELSRFLLDERGHRHGAERKPFQSGPLVVPEQVEGQTDQEYRRARWHASLRWRNGRMQDHKPLIEQTEAVGHAVRAGYIYAAMADIARFMDAPEYERAVDSLWQNVVGRKMYVNGAVGTAQYGDEGFGDPYLLPNRTYCESCASIAHVLWQHRMNLLKAQAKHADVMELALYNAVLAGISLSGDGFFYQNPLESNGAKRSSWIGLACCPTNLTRILPQVGGLVYARGKNRIYVNLFAAGEASLATDDGTKVKLVQETVYPWDGQVKLTVTPEQTSAFEMCVRIPCWALGRPVPSDLYRFAESQAVDIELKVNGKTIDATPEPDGYVHLKRSWNAGDIVELEMPMPIRRVYAHEKIEADRGKVALMRGPIVYCLETVDHPDADVLSVTLPPEAELRAEHRAGLLGGVTALHGKGLDARHRPVTLTAVPYYAWTNREKGAMTVWIKEAPGTLLKQAGKSPVKVFLLAGQSNMQGQGVVEMDDPRDYNGGKGNLEYVMANSPFASMYAHLKDGKGKWTVRDDVWVRYKTPKQGLLAGGLTVGYTGYGHGSHIGPELQFGHVVGDFYDNQVMLIKTAWGGKSLFADFRPPSSGGQVGPCYTQMLEEVREALDNLRNDFPGYEDGGYEIAGFVWMQGWNDMCDPQAIPEYDKNLVNLVKDLRAEFRLPDLPVVIGELGNGGADAQGNMAAFREAQERGARRIANAAFVITHYFWRDPQESPNVSHGHHWCGNAESYFLIGNALGKAMIELIERSGPSSVDSPALTAALADACGSGAAIQRGR